MEREELHRRFELLKEKLDNGEILIAEHLNESVQSSLEKVRIAEDGLVDPKTIDGAIRSYISCVVYQADRAEWKEKVSLIDIQRAYFQRVDDTFGHLYNSMVDADVDPYHFADWFTSDSDRLKESVKLTDEFIDSIMDFWEGTHGPTWIHLEDSNATKAVFTGGLFPESKSNIASSTGIYFDTTILPDPFVKIAQLLKFLNEEDRCNNVVRLALQVLQYQELALVEGIVPIIAILPDRFQTEHNYRKFVYALADKDALRHAGSLFDRQFTGIDEVRKFFSQYSDTASLLADIVNPEKLLFSTSWNGDLSDHLIRFREEQPERLQIENLGDAVFNKILDKFGQSNDSFQRSQDLKAAPIIKAKTSWTWFNWMLQMNSHTQSPTDQRNLHIARALESTVSAEFSWLGNVPPEALIEIRKKGALEEIRQTLGHGVADLIKARPDNFFRTSDQVFDNLNAALADHQARVREIQSKKWKFAGHDIGSFLVVGGIEMSAAITGLPLYGVFATTAGMSGIVPTAKDLKQKLRQIRKEEETITSGVGILLTRK